MATLWWRGITETADAPVDENHRLPVDAAIGPKLFNVPYTLDFSWRLALEGRIFASSDADQNDYVTGQTSFANTTPSFVLTNPPNLSSGNVLCLPFYYQLTQAGSVAGGDINVDTEIVFPSAYASGGTSEKVLNMRPGMTNRPKNVCLLYSGATATAGYGVAVGHATLAPDVSPAEGVINIYEWQAPVGTILDPNSSLNVFTYAGTTGPTWGWVFVWGELPLAWVA